MADKPDYTGPVPLQLPQTTRLDVPGVPETPSGVHRVMRTVVDDVSKMKRAARYKLYGAIGTLMLTGLGGTAAYSKGETIETKHARLEEKQANTDKAVAVLTLRADAGEKAQHHADLKLERVEALLELELDMHGVPKSKRPAPVPEPKGDEP